MKKLIIIIAVGLLIQQASQAQGTVYLSNLGQSISGADGIGSNSWVAAGFFTGTNADGYVLNSVQLAMAGVEGSPSGFTVMLYEDANNLPESSLAMLDGSDNPSTAGIYTYTPASNLTLSPITLYFIVLTAGTPFVGPAAGPTIGYYWGLENTTPNNPSRGWHQSGYIFQSYNNGASWNEILGNSGIPEYAINATAVPEPATGALAGLSLAGFCLWRNFSRMRKAIPSK